MSDIHRKFQQYGQKLVSGDKFRYRADGYDLDLTYIFPRLIAMGIPGEGIEKNWRNDIKDVARFLNEKHGQNYLIFNLTGESYDYKKFNGQVNEEFDFPDHHPPCMGKYLAAVKAIDRWITMSPSHVAVVHCLAGRSRTGCVVVGYLLYAGIKGSNKWEPPFRSAAHAIEYFNSARSSEGQNIVLPSQVRWVHYLEKILLEKKEHEVLTNPAPIVLQTIRIIPTPLVEGGTSTFSIAKSTTGGAWTPLVQVIPLAESTKDNRPAILQKVYAQIWAEDPPRVLSVGALLKGDVELIISHSSKNAAHFSKTLNRLYSAMQVVQLAAKFPKIPLFRFIFHTSFIKDDRLIIRASDLDAPLAGPVDTGSHISRDILLELVFERPLGSVQLPVSASLNIAKEIPLPSAPAPALPSDAPPPMRPTYPPPEKKPIPTVTVHNSSVSILPVEVASNKAPNRLDSYNVAPGMVVLAAVHGGPGQPSPRPSPRTPKLSPQVSPKASPQVSPRNMSNLSPAQQRTASYGVTHASAPLESSWLGRPRASSGSIRSIQHDPDIHYSPASPRAAEPPAGQTYNPYTNPFHSALFDATTNPFVRPPASNNNLTPAQAAVAVVQNQGRMVVPDYPPVLPQQDPRSFASQNARNPNVDLSSGHYGANAYMYNQEVSYQPSSAYQAVDAGQIYIDPNVPVEYNPYAQYPSYQQEYSPQYPSEGALQPPPPNYYYY